MGADPAVTWNNGAIHDLGVLRGGDTASRANGINDAGQIVGTSCKAQDAPTLPGSPECRAFVSRKNHNQIS